MVNLSQGDTGHIRLPAPALDAGGSAEAYRGKFAICLCTYFA
ncbi:Hypothetical protein ETEE_2048 [Edwardsiella anguillarum ET080813]|uniref:Uncharacterized protein n=1 Tax=Edwardsiella anguillarum ET080813 TaxID=667120 RepID=A0A076LPF0_9GAMM|nr:Hypothetical protein ETEE_2048 [Edwardsiella anguillarum ET080813]